MRRKKGWLVKHSFHNDFVNKLEEIQDTYGEEVFKIQGIANKHLDIVEFSNSFFTKSSTIADKTIDSNANISESSIISYDQELCKPSMKLHSLYSLHQMIKREFSIDDANIALERIVAGDIFVNDLVNVNKAYCFAFELRNMLYNGLNFSQADFIVRPPKRSRSFIQLLIQATAYISNQIMGACSYPDFFPILDYFYRKEYGDDYSDRMLNDKEFCYKINNDFQDIIYSLCWSFRGSQSPFSNLSVMDKGFLNQLFDGYTIPITTDGEFRTEEINIDSTLELSKRFFEYYTHINSNEGIFTFPVMTLAMSIGEDGEFIDPDFIDWVSSVSCKKALGNIFIDKPTSFSSCCRLINNFDNISNNGYQNSFGVGGLSVGSHRVAGINFPRFGVRQGVLKENIEIEDLLDTLYKILYAHRKILEERIAQGKLSLYNSGWMHLSRQYSTIGFVGLNEYLNYIGYDIKTEEGSDKAVEILNQIETCLTKYQQFNNDTAYDAYYINGIPYNKYTKFCVIRKDDENNNEEFITVEDLYIDNKYLDYYMCDNTMFETFEKITQPKTSETMNFNIEQIPAENLAVRLAQIDSELGYNINNYGLYSNQYVPLTEGGCIYNRFKIQGKIDQKVSGGGILHINVDDAKPLTAAQFKDLIMTAKETKTRYFAVNYAFSKCVDKHFSVGKHDICPVCNKAIETQFTRVVGFLTPVRSWSKTRREEDYVNRVFYTTNELVQ